jgi:leucyl/phenylalanyl-tRNA--protein transferase
MNTGNAPSPLTPQLLLRIYAAGIFPMAETADDPGLFWLDPEMRGILPLDDGFHVSRRLQRTLRQARLDVACDSAFDETVAACAAARPVRPSTWINDEIRRLAGALHEMGHAHSIECRQDGELVGGLYGISLGGAFFGESMFSTARDASKVALCHLVARLRRGGFTLLDTQFITEHLMQFGAIEITHEDYHARLAVALKVEASFYLGALSRGDLTFRQSLTQTS